MQSMTGFGRAEAVIGNQSLVVEITSVNRRNLDLSVHLPRDWQGLEAGVSSLLRDALSRGKLSVQVQLNRPGAAAGMPSWDEASLKQLLTQLEAVCGQVGARYEPDADLVLRLLSQLTPALPEADEVSDALNSVLTQAIDALISMREQEGSILKVDLLSRIGELESCLATVQEHSAKTVPNYREVLMERLEKAGLELELEDERVLREIALFADRCDISEEQTRLAAHLEQFRACCEADEPVGRKLDFLCQEILREINTIGSKANSLEITRVVVDMKNELERVREQVQNVE